MLTTVNIMFSFHQHTNYDDRSKVNAYHRGLQIRVALKVFAIICATGCTMDTRNEYRPVNIYGRLDLLASAQLQPLYIGIRELSL
jgi:hypothetical protein